MRGQVLDAPGGDAAPSAWRDHRKAVLAGAVGESCVVGHERVEQLRIQQSQCGHKMDCAECSDGRGRNRLGGRKRRLVHGKQRDPVEQGIGCLQRVLANSEAAELYSQQPAGDMLLEGRELAYDGRRVRLTEQDAPERARIDIDTGHRSETLATAQRGRTDRLSARKASVVPGGALLAGRRAAIASSRSIGTVEPNRPARSK